MGWFDRKPKYDATSFLISAEQLPKLLTELNDSWDFSLHEMHSGMYGLPVHIRWRKECNMYLVWLGPAYVESLSKMIPIYTIEERYGDTHST